MAIRVSISEYANIVTIANQVRKHMDPDDFLDEFVPKHLHVEYREAMEQMYLIHEVWIPGGPWTEDKYVWAWMEN